MVIFLSISLKLRSITIKYTQGFELKDTTSADGFSNHRFNVNFLHEETSNYFPNDQQKDNLPRRMAGYWKPFLSVSLVSL